MSTYFPDKPFTTVTLYRGSTNSITSAPLIALLLIIGSHLMEPLFKYAVANYCNACDDRYIVDHCMKIDDLNAYLGLICFDSFQCYYDACSSRPPVVLVVPRTLRRERSIVTHGHSHNPFKKLLPYLHIFPETMPVILGSIQTVGDQVDILLSVWLIETCTGVRTLASFRSILSQVPLRPCSRAKAES